MVTIRWRLHAFVARLRWVLMISDIRLSPLYSPWYLVAMTAVLRHVQGVPLRRLLPPLRHAAIPSVAANPVFPALDLPWEDQ